MSTGQGFLGYNMFAYCLNNPICYMDDSGSAAKINFDHSMNVEQSPWREDSPGGGGYVYRAKQRGPSYYGEVEDKFLTVLFFKWATNILDSIYDNYMQSYNVLQEAQEKERELIATVSPRIRTAGMKAGTQAVITTLSGHPLLKAYHIVHEKEPPTLTFGTVVIVYISGYIGGACMEIWNIIEEEYFPPDA